MKLTVLGCGSSIGVPGAGGFWGKCDPAHPRNERTRASVLVQKGETDILIDATVDLRLHLNRAGISDLDALLLSHHHSDHVNGLDDLRPIAYHGNKLIDLYTDRETMDELVRRWPYLFEAKHGGIYVEFMKAHEIAPYNKFTVGEIEVETFAQDHTTCTSLGFRFGDIAYSVDVADLDDRALDVLRGVDTWIVDAAGYYRENVVTHANLARVMKWVDILKPRMTYLTVLTSHMDYQTLCDELPPHIRPAYDGLVIESGTNSR